MERLLQLSVMLDFLPPVASEQSLFTNQTHQIQILPP